MKILEGKKIAENILEEIARGIKNNGSKPGLAVILVGRNEASEIYVRLKKERAERIGIDFHLFRFEEGDSEEKIMKKIIELNEDWKINGIIIQLPIPKKFNTQELINTIDPSKDVDGFHPENIKLFLENKERFFPVFPQAIFNLIENAERNIRNKKAVVIANSKLFGEMMTKIISRKGAYASYILRKDLKNNLEEIKNSDIIVTATGVPGIINGDMVKEGVIIVDGGIAKRKNKVFGDADFSSFKNISGFISPVPGGVGPVTVACLLRNVFESFRNSH